MDLTVDECVDRSPRDERSASDANPLKFGPAAHAPDGRALDTKKSGSLKLGHENDLGHLRAHKSQRHRGALSRSARPPARPESCHRAGGRYRFESAIQRLFRRLLTSVECMRKPS